MADFGPSLRYESLGHVALLTLARADAMNAVNEPLRTGIVAACRTIAQDQNIRALLLRAEGDRAFCVGADIKEASSGPSPQPITAERDYTTALAALPIPSICAIQGFCLGAGLEIALACDVRIATEDATFGLPEVNLGLIPGAGGTQRLTRLIGIGRTLDMVFCGERISAATAREYGLVTRIAPDRASLDTMAVELATMLANKPPLAMRSAKEAIQQGLQRSLPKGLELERELFVQLQGTEDRREAAEAFRNKRAGVFVGR